MSVSTEPQSRQPFGVEVTQLPRAACVALYGEIDLSTAAEIEAAICSAVALRKRVVVDLRGVDFMDSSGVAVLVRTAQENGVELTVAARSGPVARLLQMCGLERELALTVDP